MVWQVFDSGKKSAKENMLLDAELLSKLNDCREGILHLYEWKHDAASFGLFIEPAAFLNMENVKKRNLELAKRPTGGGIVFHITDYAFSVLVPSSHPAFSSNTLENYRFVNEKVIEAIAPLYPKNFSLLSKETPPKNTSCNNFCMAKPTKFDVMMGDKKVGGAAQRKTRFGYLHQGTIFIASLKEIYLEEILLPKSEVIPAMKANSFPLLSDDFRESELLEVRDTLKKRLIEVFTRV